MLKKGTVLVINKSERGGVRAVVTDVRHYKSFEDYLSSEGLRTTLPGVTSIQEGVAVYRQFYSSADEAEHGVVAVEFQRTSRAASRRRATTT